MNFETTAMEVVRDSIRSAICIDDKYASAYTEPTEGLNFTEPKELYYSFRKKGKCDLDIYQFKNLPESWDKEAMLSNKDLMILDWELDSQGGHQSTLSILEDVLESKKIPFVVVYTATDDLDTVGKTLMQHFSPYDNKDVAEFSTKLEKNISKVSEDPSEIDSFFEAHGNRFFEMVHHWNRRDDLLSEIIAKMKTTLKIKEAIGEQAILKKVQGAMPEKFEAHDAAIHFGLMALSYESEKAFSYELSRVEVENHVYRINGATILVYRKKEKGGIAPDELFEHFSRAIVNNPYNYLSILSHELRDRLREGFSRIGTGFSQTNEIAFFYHLSNYRKADDKKKFDIKTIYDFILNSWISELHQQQLDTEPRLLNFVSDRYSKIKESIPSPLSEGDGKTLKDLVRYSSFISTTNVHSRSDNRLRLGDLFYNKSKPDQFFLCITPACDCLRPDEKIDNNFYFVKGTKGNDFKALKEAETEFHSFVIRAEDPISVDWKCKPFTAHIVKNNINSMSFNHMSQNISLVHLTVLKSSYVQRISNQSFGYGFRVGIDLPHINGEET